jgi:hypothetical protein
MRALTVCSRRAKAASEVVEITHSPSRRRRRGHRPCRLTEVDTPGLVDLEAEDEHEQVARGRHSWPLVEWARFERLLSRNVRGDGCSSRSRAASIAGRRPRRAAQRIDDALVDALLAAAERAAGDPGCRSVLLAGAPPVFCQGSDVASFGDLTSDAILRREGRWPALRDAFRGVEAPVLAKIQGGAFGGGLFLALYADYRIAEERAFAAAPEVRLG